MRNIARGMFVVLAVGLLCGTAAPGEAFFTKKMRRGMVRTFHPITKVKEVRHIKDPFVGSDSHPARSRTHYARSRSHHARSHTRRAARR